jgi:hypothetical protein
VLEAVERGRAACDPGPDDHDVGGVIGLEPVVKDYNAVRADVFDHPDRSLGAVALRERIPGSVGAESARLVCVVA